MTFEITDDPGRIRQLVNFHGVGVRHTIAAEDVLLEYRLRQNVSCGFGEHHLHQRGYVGALWCDRAKIINIGQDCAKTAIVGWAEVFAKISREKARRQDVNTIADLPSLRRRLRTAIGLASEILVYERDVLEHGNANFAIQMRRRQQRRDDLTDEVTIKLYSKDREWFWDSPKSRGEREEIARLRGLEAWSLPPNLDAIGREADVLVADVADLGDLHAHRADTLHDLANRVKQLSAKVGEIDRWIDAAMPFFAYSNLRIAFYAVGGLAPEKPRRGVVPVDFGGAHWDVQLPTFVAMAQAA